MAILTGNADLFRARLHQGSLKNRLPVRAMFELTYRCNFSCLHCYNSDAQKATRPAEELTTQEIFEIIDQIKEIGCYVLGFTGGEVFVRPEAMEIFHYAKRSGFQVLIYTNGYLIDERVADQLQELGPNKVDISIHGFTRGTFEKITQLPGSQERVFRAIDLLTQRGIPVGIKSNLFEFNKDELRQVKEFASSRGASYRWSPRFFARNDGSMDPYQYQLTEEKVSQVAEGLGQTPQINEGKEEAPRKRAGWARGEKLFSCGFGYTDLVINPFGEVKLCLELGEPRFKVKGSSLRASWQEAVDFVDREITAALEQREPCELRPYCDCCPVQAYLATGNFAACDPTERRRAEIRKKRLEEIEPSTVL